MCLLPAPEMQDPSLYSLVQKLWWDGWGVGGLGCWWATQEVQERAWECLFSGSWSHVLWAAWKPNPTALKIVTGNAVIYSFQL